MTHWGWYWSVKRKSHIPKKKCSKFISIDSFKLLKNGTCGGFTVFPLQVQGKMENNNLTVSYRNQAERSYTIPIERQPCNFGGYRYFFKCPLCQRRMRFLYFAENSIFLCRKCLNLCYDTQRLRPTKRYAHTEDKIKKMIEGKGGSSYKKPPRMHNATYQRLKSKQHYYEQKSCQALNNEMRLWFGDKAEPYIDGYFDYVDETKEWRKKKAS